MDIEKDWFKIFLAVGSVGWTLWMLFFRKNNDVFTLMIKNQEARLEKLEKLLEKQDERLDKSDQKTVKLETLFEGLAQSWKEMGAKYEAREAALIKANELKDEELKLKTAEAAAAKSVQVYQKKAFSDSIDAMLKIQKDAFLNLSTYEKGDRKTA